MLADHRDAPSCSDTNVEGPCIHKQGYNCQQSDLVVPNAYLINESQEIILHRDFCGAEKISYSSSLTKNHTNHSQGRAPPAHV